MGSEVVDDHLRLCEELLTLLKEENRRLKHQGEAPDETTLERKRELLPAFDASLAAMRTLQENEPHLLPSLREKLKNAQTDILKLDCGHISLIAGSRAVETVWKPIAHWLAQ